MNEFPVAFLEDDSGTLIVSEPPLHRSPGSPPKRHRSGAIVKAPLTSQQASATQAAPPTLIRYADPIRHARGILRHCLSTGWVISAVDEKDAVVAIGTLTKPGSGVRMQVRGERDFFTVLRQTLG